MRFLLVNNHCISDPTAGVTHSLRTIVEWLADAGHACHILTTARFESRVTFTIEAAPCGSRMWTRPSSRPEGRTINGAAGRRCGARCAGLSCTTPCGMVPVTLLLTAPQRRRANPIAARPRSICALLDELLVTEFAPDRAHRLPTGTR